MSGFPVVQFGLMFSEDPLLDGVSLFQPIAYDWINPILQVFKGSIALTGNTITADVAAPLTTTTLTLAGKAIPANLVAPVSVGSLTLSPATLTADAVLAAGFAATTLTLSTYQLRAQPSAIVSPATLTLTGATVPGQSYATAFPAAALTLTGKSMLWYWSGTLQVAKTTIALTGKAAFANGSTITAAATLTITGQTTPPANTLASLAPVAMQFQGKGIDILGWLVESQQSSIWAREQGHADWYHHWDDPGLLWSDLTPYEPVWDAPLWSTEAPPISPWAQTSP